MKVAILCSYECAKCGCAMMRDSTLFCVQRQCPEYRVCYEIPKTELTLATFKSARIDAAFAEADKPVGGMRIKNISA